MPSLLQSVGSKVSGALGYGGGGLVTAYATNVSNLAVVTQRVAQVEQSQEKLEKLTETGRVERNAQVDAPSHKIDAWATSSRR